MKKFNHQLNKILIINDLHFGKSRKSTSRSGIIRQANTQSEETFKSLIPYFNNKEYDLVIQMGDIIRDTYEKSLDIDNASRAIKAVNSITHPKFHILGNHDIEPLSRE